MGGSDEGPQLHDALSALSSARQLAIEVFERDFPALFRQSAMTFAVTPVGSTQHRLRLGEFLTERSNALGTTPLDALTADRVGDVHATFSHSGGCAPTPSEKGLLIGPSTIS